MTTTIDRRQFLAGSAALAAAGIVPIHAVARQASPAAPGATPTADGVDVPVLQIAYTAAGVSVSPAEIPAGTVRMLASSDGTDDQGYLLFRVPDDQDVDQVRAQATAPGDDIPDWFWTTFVPGGVRDDSHVPAVAEGFIVLDPGSYIVLDELTNTDAAFTVTGAAGASPNIPATMHITAEDSMTFTGLEEPVPAGRQLWQFDNGGKLHHSINIFSRPEGATADDLHAIFEGLFSGTPPAGNPFEGYGDSTMSTSMLSGGRTQWFYLDLAPGPYVAMCTSFDSLEAPPHFMMGMIVTFTVE
jgi:hypothetical protein